MQGTVDRSSHCPSWVSKSNKEGELLIFEKLTLTIIFRIEFHHQWSTQLSPNEWEIVKLSVCIQKCLLKVKLNTVFYCQQEANYPDNLITSVKENTDSTLADINLTHPTAWPIGRCVLFELEVWRDR